MYFCPGAMSSMFIWDSCLYVVGFAPEIILANVFLPWFLVICVHLGLVYVHCWFCTANLSCKCVFATMPYHMCSFGTRLCTLLVFAPLIFLGNVFLHRCLVICVHLGLVYVCCGFCIANHSCKCVFASVPCHMCSFGTRVCML